MVLPPETVRRLETDGDPLLLELSPEAAVAMAGMVGCKSMQQSNQQLLVISHSAR
jgi:hypothetical protein